jgi:serine acetyltransferase
MGSHRLPRRLRNFCRITWTIASLVVVESLICGLALMPAVLIWTALLPRIERADGLFRTALVGVSIVPSYGLFALTLMAVSPLATRILGWRTAPDAEMVIADVGWPLLAWVRHMVAIHLVRLFAGTLFRGTPIWTAYLRLSGARVGRRAYINSLAVSDYNLLEIGDDVVIGEDAHVSGHTVERGIVKTGRVRLGRGVTIGLGTVIEIGVTIGDGCEVGALSLVPKHTTLLGPATYVGIPVRRLA